MEILRSRIDGVDFTDSTQDNWWIAFDDFLLLADIWILGEDRVETLLNDIEFLLLRLLIIAE